MQKPAPALLCLECRRLTEAGERCRHCGAILPSREEPPRLAGTLEEIRRRSLELRSGDIGTGEFLAFLDGLEARFRRVLGEVADEALPEDVRSEAAEELAVGRRGVEVFLEALGTLREWAETGDRAALDTGLALATQATAHVNEAIRLNFRAFRTYQEAAEEYLRQVGYEPLG